MDDKPASDNKHENKPAKDKVENEMVDSDDKKEKQMKNDLTDSSPDLGSHDLPQIAELSKYRIERARAQNWALMDIKFLVYDDTDVAINGFDSDDEETMLSLAINRSYGDGLEALEPATECTQAEPPMSSSSSGTQTNDVERFSCRICSSYPKFPHKWKPRKFRLVQPILDHPELFSDESVKSVDICMHYVAVSYCWPPPEERPTSREYQVRDLDGGIRSNRALDDVLDRAVDFANSFGLRMIWIDQVCLPQPTKSSSKADWDEQELGIQSMDIVYNRAMVTAGLLNVEITTQAQLNAISTLLYAVRETRLKKINPQICKYILDLLFRTSHDRWYTRAWVVQEGLCAGDKLILGFRRGSGLKFASKIRRGYSAEENDRPYHSLDDTPHEHESHLVCLPLTDFWEIIDDMKYFVEHEFLHSGDHLIRIDCGPAYGSLDAQSAIKAADSLHPRFVKANTLQGNLQVYCKGHYGKRPTTDAAGALTLLKTRYCSYDSDRLAIVANMCDYDFRLDTRAVERNCSSLSQAMLALALNNGDLSLLVPETYRPRNLIYADDSHNALPERSVLFREFVSNASRVDHCRVRNFINFRMQRVRPGDVTSEGLQLPAYLWSVDEDIDFTPIRVRWAETWESLKCWRIIVDAKKSETPGQFDARRNAIIRRFSQPGISQLALLEFRMFGRVRNDSVIWEGIDNAGVQVHRHISSPRVRQEPKIREKIAHIIFDILRYTLNSSEDPQRAQGLANSIWQSVRVDQVPGSQEPLPDEVNDSLFSHKDVVGEPFATLQLDETLDDNFAQLWFVDRIMESGRLWCGTYKRPSGQLGNLPHTSSHAYSLQESPSSELATQSCPSTSAASHEEGNSRQLTPRSIIQRQILRQTLTSMLSMHLETNMRHPIVAFGEVFVCDYWSANAERRRERSLISIFKVDGPCQIATPYNPAWEILPRPDLRSMSVCWVVEPVDNASLVAEVSCGTSNKPNLQLEHGEKAETEKFASHTSTENECTDDTEACHPVKDSRAQVPAYRVLRKVKGLWQIMDLPFQEYVFN